MSKLKEEISDAVPVFINFIKFKYLSEYIDYLRNVYTNTEIKQILNILKSNIQTIGETVKKNISLKVTKSDKGAIWEIAIDGIQVEIILPL